MALLPPAFLDAVVAIGVGDDPATRRWVGTGFLYGAFDSKGENDQHNYIIFLVTNEHVLRGHKKVWLKFNDSSGGGSFDYDVKLIASNGKKLWAQHSKADVAAFFINVNALEKDGRNFSFFRSDVDAFRKSKLKEIGMTEGDGIFLLGFPMGYVDPKRQYAICRNGAVARIRDLLDGHSEEFLVDALVFPGNSGGPALSKPELAHIHGTTANSRCALIGIIQSYIPYRDTAISVQTQQPRNTFEENSGLTSVFPMDFVDVTVKSAKRRLKNRIANAKWRAKTVKTET